MSDKTRKPTLDQRRNDDVVRRRQPGEAARGRPSAGRKPVRAEHDPFAPPPVMVRGPGGKNAEVEGRHSRKAAQKSAPNVQRRWDIAYGAVPGAEARLPALPRIRLSWKMFIPVLLIALVVGAYQLWYSPVLRVKTVKVGGLKRTSSVLVGAALQMEGTPMLLVNPISVEDNLRATFPEFSQVRVQMSLPNTIAISITERTPALIWKMAGRTELVDADGWAFPIREGANLNGLPVVEAAAQPLSPDIVVDEKALQPQSDAARILSDVIGRSAKTTPQAGEAASAGSAYSRRLISPAMVTAVLQLYGQAPQKAPLMYDARHGLNWKDSKGLAVYFGDEADIAMKLSIYQALLKRLNKDEITPAVISVEYAHAPYYREKP
jgi:hypothetical protein